MFNFPESKTMNIYAKKGDQVVFKGESGRDYQIEEANKTLTKDEVYNVLYTNVGQSCSYVILREFPDKQFNTVLFEDREGGIRQ